MIVDNKNMTVIEKKWLEVILSQNFPNKEVLINQVNRAHVDREYTDFYLSLKFKVDGMAPPVKTNVRIPIEMRVHKMGRVPTQFLLHVIQGYISELEIFNADSSR